MRLEQSPAYQKLEQHLADIANTPMRDLFAADPTRFLKYSLQGPEIFLDYSKNRINDTTLTLLLDLAEERQLPQQINALFSGSAINSTENRAVLHTALRQQSSEPVMVGGRNIIEDIKNTHQRMRELVDKIHAKTLLGYTGKAIDTLVSIGIGGSFLGPYMVLEALKPYALSTLETYFVANIDGSDLTEVLEKVSPEKTLFLIQSKSFGTLETIENAKATRSWLLAQGASIEDTAKHFFAVTANNQKANSFGIPDANIFPMWDWVGGRYSLWSAIGLPIVFQCGMEVFQALLSGANAMDEHFRNEKPDSNLPIIMAMLGIWYVNFFRSDSQAILPYDEYLKHLPLHLQQVDMESNGKRVDKHGQTVKHKTGPIIWGAVGCNGQHAYHQLLHQGTPLIPADFIIPLHSHNPIAEHHAHLYSNCLGQSQALMSGKTYDEAYKELMANGESIENAERLAPHKVVPGNKPSNTLILKKLTPQSLGSLIALYEHKVFVQGVIWGINSFDQWGVELGKSLGDVIFSQMKESSDDDTLDASTDTSIDASTTGLIRKFQDS